MQKERFRLLQSSMQFSDTDREIERDSAQIMEDALHRDVDVIGFTETTKANDVFPIIKRAVEKEGWWFQAGVAGSSRFAVNPRHKIKESGYIHVLDARSGGAKGNYAARGVVEVTLKTPLNNIITVHGSHWLTAYDLDRKPGAENRRERRHDEQTEAIIDRVVLHGRGRRISFWMGDTNIDEEKDTGFDRDAIEYQFRKAGLESIYDAVYGVGDRRLPPTNGKGTKTIDIIGHYKPDARVVPLRVHVLPRRGRSIDHLMVLADYSINTPERRPIRDTPQA